MSILYIDLKSAYNTVNRNKLFDIMKKKKVLFNEEIEFLQLLNENIYFIANGKKHYFQNGVH